MSDYGEFLKSKEIRIPDCGIDAPELSDHLFDFQSDIVSWALRRGRAAIFADCGLGKTLMQLEWGRCVPGDVLLLAPLAVAGQTCREADKFGIEGVRYSGDGRRAAKITITNYERVSKFDPSEYSGIILDESSILKSYDGKYRTEIIESFSQTPYRLACTATPAPNDHMELGNHSEFLGIMGRSEMLSMFFVHDGGETQKWRLKGHAESDFWRWICSWAVMIKKPSDLGYSDGKFILPPLDIVHHEIESSRPPSGLLFDVPALTLQDRNSARRDTIIERAGKCADLINKTTEPWVVWCNLNAESAALADAIPGAIEVKGADSSESKEAALLSFSSGKSRVIVTKPRIAGFGMNWQHCSNVAFVGLSDSYEQYYQAIRRCWRFGQKRPVKCHIITSKREGAVVQNIRRKEEDAEKMAQGMVENMKGISSVEIKGATKTRDVYEISREDGDGWTMYLGDCVESSSNIEDDSIGYTIFSPPFASLYTYSNSNRDMGNCKDDDQFARHFEYLIGQLYRVTMPGRLVSFHCMNIPTSKTHHGYIGIRDFRGELIRAFADAGFIYHSEVVIWKDPVTAMQRTKALGLLHKQLVKDSAMSRQGVPDYLVTMRKPGENTEPVAGELDHFCGDQSTFANTGRLSIDIWQRYASPVWSDINPSDTLQFRNARHKNDERHICPLQLQVIHRGLQLWSNPGDLVFSPFAGIGSEGYESIKLRRRFVGIELKRSYYEQAIINLGRAESERDSDTLFGAAADV